MGTGDGSAVTDMYEKPYHQHDLSGQSFLVTGGAGFIGSHLAEYLLKYKARRVRIIDNLITGQRDNIRLFLPAPAFEFIEGDIRNLSDCRKACEGIDYIFHEAALGSVPRSVRDPLTTNSINVDGFVNMLVAAREAKVRRIIYASSSSVYGDHPGLPKREGATGLPLSPYAASKQADELYAQVFARVYGMEIAGLRYFNVFGPRQSPDGPYAAVVPIFINALLHGQEVFIDGDGSQTRDFTFVENVVQANILAMFAKDEILQKAPLFNVAVGENFSIIELFERIRQLTGSQANPVFRKTREGDIKNSLADISLARTLLHYKPAIRFDNGLEHTVAYCRKAGFK